MRPELMEDVELDPEHKKYVLDVHDQLATLDHYALLGVPRDATKKAIKSAYFRIASTIHPDRHFKKRLGSFKARMEAIFVRVESAYQTLTDVDARAKYDATLGLVPSKAPSEKPAFPSPKSTVDPKREAERKAALEALKSRFQAARANGKETVAKAEAAWAGGDVEEALRLYEMAAGLMPDDAALRSTIEMVRRQGHAKLAESYARKAALEERFGRWAAAAQSWQKVVDARPDDVEARRRLAEARARAGA